MRKRKLCQQCHHFTRRLFNCPCGLGKACPYKFRICRDCKKRVKQTTAMFVYDEREREKIWLKLWV